jgi:hypothetical protein
VGGQDLEVLAHPETVGGDDPVGPTADLVLGGRHHVLAVGPEPRVDPLVAAEAADRVDALLAGLAHRDRRPITEPA